MENLQQQTMQTDTSAAENTEVSENKAQQTQDVQSSDNSELILGKFKSLDELTKAYKNMESQHGQQSKELGELRKKAELFENLQKQSAEKSKHLNEVKDFVQKNVSKYDNEQYFKNPEFANLYKEAFVALGTNLDSDKFVSLLENYVNSRINMHEKAKSAKSETESAKSQMQFSDSSASKKSSKTLPKIDTMSKDKIDEFVAKYI